MNKLKLTDREWGEFFIGGKNGIFSIKATKSGIDKNKLNTEIGNIPYITRTDMDNGINLFITSKQNNKYKQDSGNIITIGLDTQTVFYQQNSFYTGQNIQVLTCDKLNKQIAMFVIPLLKIQMRKFSWGGNGATLGRLNRTKIMLPTNKYNEPDWQFMEDYIKQIEKDKIETLLSYLNQYNILAEPSRAEPSRAEPSRAEPSRAEPSRAEPSRVVWATFKLSQVFSHIQRGKRLTKNNQFVGNIPYVSSSSLNNGVDNFIANEKDVRIFKKCLTLANSGSVGSSFYQDYLFVASDHITALSTENGNRYVYLFLATQLNKLSEKYSFNREINDKRIQKEMIMLPIDSKGEPHWEYMQSLMKEIEIKNILKILQYYNKGIN